MPLMEIEAVYVQGALNLPRELPFREGQKVRITIQGPTVPSSATGDKEETAEQTLELRWTKARSRIRAAAKRYSEETHADY